MATFPSFWVPGSTGYPNIENLLKQMFTPLIGGIEVTYWLPDEETIEETIASGGGYLRIYRVGGRVDFDQNRDEPNVQIAAMTKSRDDSWEVMEFVRTGVLELGYQDGNIVPGTPHHLQYLGELLGPQLIPGQLRDERLVPATFMLRTRKPKGLEKYRGAIGL